MELLKCVVCWTIYTPTNKPLVLPCGHTFCYTCIEGLKKKHGIIVCPLDRKECGAELNDIPTNYSVLSMLGVEPKELKAGLESAKAEVAQSLAASSKPKKYVVVDYGDGKTYFFVGSMYYRFDNRADVVDAGYPLPIATGWKGLWPDGVDACLVCHPHALYFYKGTEYVRYNIGARCVDAGYPKKIAGHLPGVGLTSIDAAMNGNNGKAYFFKGSQYYRFDFQKGKADAGYPMTISAGWNGVWSDGIDSATMWSPVPNKAYFFRGSSYIRFDIFFDVPDSGYPMSISQGWKGIPNLS